MKLNNSSTYSGVWIIQLYTNGLDNRASFLLVFALRGGPITSWAQGLERSSRFPGARSQKLNELRAHFHVWTKIHEAESLTNWWSLLINVSVILICWCRPQIFSEDILPIVVGHSQTSFACCNTVLFKCKHKSDFYSCLVTVITAREQNPWRPGYAVDEHGERRPLILMRRPSVLRGQQDRHVNIIVTAWPAIFRLHYVHE